MLWQGCRTEGLLVLRGLLIVLPLDIRIHAVRMGKPASLSRIRGLVQWDAVLMERLVEDRFRHVQPLIQLALMIWAEVAVYRIMCVLVLAVYWLLPMLSQSRKL